MGTRTLYPPDIHTVYVPIIESNSYRRQLGEWLTEAVAKEIENVTPFKVVNTPEADSVLDDVRGSVDSLIHYAADKLFRKRVEAFYSDEDLKSGTTLSFNRNGERVNIGLIKLVAVVADQRLGIEKSRIIQAMGRACEAMESSGEDVRLMKDEPTS